MKNPPRKRRVFSSRATPTGLEPAASAVTGRRSNQLSYGAKLQANLRAQSTHLLANGEQTANCIVTPAGFEPALPP